MLAKMTLIAVGSWLLMTIFIDFMAIPVVFRTVSETAEAGQVGASLFSLFNKLELMCAALFLGWAFVSLKDASKKVKRGARVLALALAGITASYLVYFTPGIAEYSNASFEAFQNGKSLVFDEHFDFLHQTYVKLDAIKLLLLAAALVLCFRQTNFKSQRSPS